ncbi:MAG TPA: hypothetical protein PJ988_10885 [Anaerolinea sp.]|nr:hypothetical protein [Anaerolinea sp.]
MPVNPLFSEPFLAGVLLILGFLTFFPAGLLYTYRAIWNKPGAKNPVFLYWERGLVIAAVVVVVLGWGLLERMLEAASDTTLAPLGWTTMLLSAVLVLVAEAYNLTKQDWLQALVVVHVVLAFLAQAVFGAALLRTGLLPAWIGWATILWSLGLLVYLPIFKPRDMYFPWLHYIAPLRIGIGLLVRG